MNKQAKRFEVRRVMKWFGFLLIVVAGCRQPSVTAVPDDTKERAVDSSRDGVLSAPQTLGGHGATCRCGEHRGMGSQCIAVPCAEGLVCAYGCGIPGCDSTCLTPQEADAASTVP